MKVRKFLGETPRATLRSVKGELGDDAVILSSRQVSGGFEVMAMSQQDVSSIASAAPAGKVPLPSQPALSPESGPRPFMEYALSRPGAKVAMPSPGTAFQNSVDDSRLFDPDVHLPKPKPTPTPAPAHGNGKNEPEPAVAGGSALVAELRSMRSLLEGQLANLAWSDSARRAPLKMKLAGEMLAAGFSPAVSRAATSNLPDDFTPAQASKWLASLLEANLRQAAVDTLVDSGGVYALVGPTGVGKTTTTAKLAARYVMKFGAQKLGLISADSYRIGAQDQLRAYGRILGVPVHAVQDAPELHATLAALRDKHLVLIDTIGVGQRNPKVSEQISLLDLPRVRRLLLLNASSQSETLEDVVRAYCGRGLAGCCFTKIDEAVKLGGVLGCAMHHRLPLHYVSNGQRVPEDLHLPNIPYLVHRALRNEMSESHGLSETESALLLVPTKAAGGKEHEKTH